ncbi:dihydrofolate reductase [bacterium]|nr:dihydrofolate reductase [bacterium]
MRVHILIALTTEKWVMGKNNSLPWHLPEDLKRFKRLTMGHPIIMGRKTYDSIGKPLPGRDNIVLTRDKNLKIDGCTTCTSIAKAFERCEYRKAEKAFIIGGAQILKEALPLADELNITWIDKDFDGDVFFPKWNFDKYKKSSEQICSEPFDHRYVDYVRV